MSGEIVFEEIQIYSKGSPGGRSQLNASRSLRIVAEILPTPNSWLPKNNLLLDHQQSTRGRSNPEFRKSHVKKPSRPDNGACHSRETTLDMGTVSEPARSVRDGNLTKIFTTILSLGLSDSRACSLLNQSRPLSYARRTVFGLACGYRLNREYETTETSKSSAVLSVMHSTSEALRNRLG